MSSFFYLIEILNYLKPVETVPGPNPNHVKSLSDVIQEMSTPTTRAYIGEVKRCDVLGSQCGKNESNTLLVS